MTPKLCKCGAIVSGRCEKCYKTRVDGRSSHERGYDWQWRKLSERYRARNPLCEVCYMQGKTKPATSVHHVVSIEHDASRRLDVTNLIAVCESCHKQMEGKPDPRTGGGKNVWNCFPNDGHDHTRQPALKMNFGEAV